MLGDRGEELLELVKRKEKSKLGTTWGPLPGEESATGALVPLRLRKSCVCRVGGKTRPWRCWFGEPREFVVFSINFLDEAGETDILEEERRQWDCLGLRKIKV